MNILFLQNLMLFLQVNKFKIEAQDIGQIQKIGIDHNLEKLSSGWYLEKVEQYLIFYFIQLDFYSGTYPTTFKCTIC